MEKVQAKHEVRIDRLEKDVDKIKEAVQTMHKTSTSLDNLTETLREYIAKTDVRMEKQSDRIIALEGAGARRWDLVITTGITALIMGVVFFVLLQLGITPQ